MGSKSLRWRIEFWTLCLTLSCSAPNGCMIMIRLPGGVYNFGSETTKSMYEITKYFLEILHRDLPVHDCAPLHNLWMNCEKARHFGVVFSSVEDGLKKCFEDLKMF